MSGLRHIGLPIRDTDKTAAFCEKSGFSVLWQTALIGAPVRFLRGPGITVEAYQSVAAAGAVPFQRRERPLGEIRGMDGESRKRILLYTNAAGALTTAAPGAIPAMPGPEAIARRIES